MTILDKMLLWALFRGEFKRADAVREFGSTANSYLNAAYGYTNRLTDVDDRRVRANVNNPRPVYFKHVRRGMYTLTNVGITKAKNVLAPSFALVKKGAASPLRPFKLYCWCHQNLLYDIFGDRPW